MTTHSLPRLPFAGAVPLRTEADVTARVALEDDTGPGSMVLVLERFGDGRPDTTDRAWVHQLRHACTAADARLRGIWLSSDEGVDLLP